MVLPSSRGDLIRGHRGRCLSLPLIFCFGRLPGSFSTHVFALVEAGPCACPPYAARYVHPLGATRYSLPATFPPRPLRSRRDAAGGRDPCRSQRSLTQRHLWRRPQRSATLSTPPRATCNGCTARQRRAPTLYFTGNPRARQRRAPIVLRPIFNV